VRTVGSRPRRPLTVALLAVVVATAALAGLWVARSVATPTPRDPLDLDSLASYPPIAVESPGGSVTLSGAGDIVRCDEDRDEATAALLDDLPGWVFTAGDNVYDDGTAREFEECYGPSWGRHRERTLPAPGNHDFKTRRAAGYFGYFGERAGDPRAGWYATDLGAWRLIVLASNCDEVGGCGPDSDQGRWLARELEAHPRRCTIAVWHHPRFSTGEHGPIAAVTPFWEALHPAGVELIVNGHDHSYERFVPLDAAGRRDADRGIRQIVVGTGGARLRGFPGDDPNSVVRSWESHGVLRLDLHDDSYDWEFIPVAGGEFTDRGSGTCH
jgi:hypothetical protein